MVSVTDMPIIIIINVDV